jgi:glutathione synthase/RimK-type ligase-like ATP-grasp enzyme
MKVNHYFVAGLDFIFDKRGKPWFVEANYAPLGSRHMLRLYKDDLMTKAIAKMMKKQGSAPAIVSSTKKIVEENNEWYYKHLMKFLPNLRFCPMELNRTSRHLLTDENDETFKPTCIFRYEEDLQRSFEKRMMVINPTIIQKIVNSKIRTLKIAKEAGLDVPETYPVRTKRHALELMKEHPRAFKDGFVLKPNDNTEGFGVHVLDHKDKLPPVHGYRLLEQRIIPRLHHHDFWDVRVFVIDGKYIGGFVRDSKKRVTNITLGAKPEKLPSKLKARLRNPSLKVIKAIDDFASKR